MLPALLTVLSIALGFALDCLLGDPAWLPHPVRWIGRLIRILERLLRRGFPSSPGGERTAGILLVLLTAGISTAVPAGIVWVCWLLHPIAFTEVQTLFCYQILAVNSLKPESMKVAKALQAGDLPGARQAVSRIVGRDTDSLDTQQVAKAAVETVAENTTDGVVSPLFFLALGGAPLGFLYKAVNTMDSMVGYRNDTYRYFGTAAAKTDDVCNWIPARISALCMLFAAWIFRRDAKNAWRIYRRDRRNHSSPNSAQTESVCAGALHIQLAGDAYYGGKLCRKPTIGDPGEPVGHRHIAQAVQLMTGTAGCALALFLLLDLTVLRLLF